MRKLMLAAPIACLSLLACTPQDAANVQALQTKIQNAINMACADATTAAGFAAPFASDPTVTSILGYVEAGCGTATAVAALVTKAVNDPGTIAWTENLAGQLQTAVAKLSGSASAAPAARRWR